MTTFKGKDILFQRYDRRLISVDGLSVLSEVNTVRNPEIDLITLVTIVLSRLTWIIPISNQTSGLKDVKRFRCSHAQKEKNQKIYIRRASQAKM